MKGEEALSVLGALRDALLIVDSSLGIRYANRAAHDLVGWDDGTLVGQSLGTLLGATADVETLVRAAVADGDGAVVAATDGDRDAAGTVSIHHRSGNQLSAVVQVHGVPFNGDRAAAVSLRGIEGTGARPLAGVEHRLLQIVSDDVAVDAIPHRIVELLGVELGWDAAGFWQVDGEVLRSAAQWLAPGFSAASFAVESRASTFGRGEGLLGRVWAEAAPAWIPEIGAEVSDGAGPSVDRNAQAVGLRTAVAFPVVDGDELLAVIDLFSRERRNLDRAQLGLFATVGRELGRVLGRRLADEQIRDERQRLQLATEIANLGVWDWSPDRGVISSANLAAWLGFPDERRRPVEEIMTRVPDDDRAMLIQAIEQLLADGTEYHLVHRAWRSDGTVAWLEHRGRPRRDPSGRIVGVTGVAMDITQRLEAEAEREGLLLRERAARAQVEAVFDETRHLAETLQKSLLPRQLPRVPGVELASLYRAAAHQPSSVGGDFYDVFPLSGQQWGLVVGDVCGKGPEAAALTAQVRFTVRAAAMHARRCDRVVAAVDDALNYEELGGRFCSFVYARFVPLVSGIDVRFANAGHLAPAVVRADGRVDRLESTGGVVGIGGLGGWTEQRAELRLGDALVLYTDGIVDLRRPDGQSFGDDRLAWLLGRCAGLNATSAIHRIDEELRLFHPEPRDDIAVLVVRAPGAAQPASPPTEPTG